MRISVDAARGSLAAHPEAALDALAAAAVADGADRSAWLAKAATPHSPPREPLHRMVREATDLGVALYRTAMTRLRRSVRDRLSSAAASVDTGHWLGQVAKAGRKTTRLITPDVVADIAEAVRAHHGAVAAALYGRDAVAAHDWEMAKALGLIPPNATPEGLTEGLHVYGAMLGHLTQAEAQERYGRSTDELLAEVKRRSIPRTQIERNAARYMAQRGATLIVGLGNRVGAEVGSNLIEADQALDAKLRGTVRDVLSARYGDPAASERLRQTGAERGLSAEFFDRSFRSTVAEQVSDLGHATNDWARDLKRIVQTESHGAVQRATQEAWEAQELAAAAAQERPPRRVLVYKLPRPDACPACVRLHLQGGVPRIWHLDELEGNGTNKGRRRPQWRAVVGSTHPYCSCSMHRVPAMLAMPKGWKSGQAAPKVIGVGGQIVMD